MKKFKHARLFTAMVLVLVLASECKKKEEPAPEPPVVNTDESGQSGKDSRDATSENDLATNDVNQVMGDNAKLSGGPGARPAGICGLSVDTTQASAGILTLNYTGVTCDNRTRTGTIVVTLLNFANGKRWKDPGAQLKVDYQNYKITRASDQASLKFNGTQVLTNVSGGNWWTLLVVKTQTALVSTVTGSNLAVTWSDNKTATYNINRRITYSLTGAVISVKGEGIGNNGTLTNLENFGTTREGDAFTSQVNTPVIWNTTCGAGAPLQGEILIKVTGKTTDLKFTYGVNAAGVVVAVAPNTCAYGWKLEWTVNGNGQSKVIGYN